MKKLIICFLSFAICGQILAQETKTFEAGQDKVKLKFMLNADGRPIYSLYFAGKTIIEPSSLGMELVNDSSFNRQFEIIGTEKKLVDEQWNPIWGEVRSIKNKYEQLTVQLKQKNAPNRLMNLVFRVFEEGLGFRYEFPKQPGLKYFIVGNELTQFNLTGDHKAFWIPGDYDTNEYSYTTSALSRVDAWEVQKKATDIAVRVVPDQYAVQTPLMLKTANGLYINLHEAAQINYPAMQLHVNRQNFSLSAHLVPDALGNKAYLHAPFNTPWRTILVADNAKSILESKMILNLNEPSVITNTDWIKPMKYVGVWWEMQTGKASWSYADDPDQLSADGNLIPSGKHGANTQNVKRYIDFAAKNGIDGVLVEGWNTGWEDWFGNWKEEVFDFVTPYPDFDLQGISDYAKSKGVKMIMHNETSGSATNYERQLDTAFKLMNTYGYPAVKTGYVGKIIPRGEHHDGQWMVNHYERVAQKAAAHKIMVDVHEPNRPTGLHRTYPNWMASEAARGNEYNAFSDGNHPDHETILPFTRLMGGPMDYTPGIFKLKGYASYAPNRQVHTTLAKQLALYVTLYSPLQMAADLPENYEAKMDAFQFIKDVAVDWDDTKIIEAEPGDYLTIARKAKGTENWFIGAITDEQARVSTIALNFLKKGTKYMAKVYRDANDASWKNNPEAYKIEQYPVTSASVLKLKLAEGGGAAISIIAVQ
ncbi:glycoside hydrolase family 97 protein [Pedobacter hiemivivus]|uniref:Glycoside hydrolase family 97 protein n=1 Tax=Pedobacter hiemivivus TaxID=2530454 RepID=A0A4U1GJX2_9SPHI|nr:glycoside hydrolase family 97 protein [Pedobacter hiemivivus]TKC63639.1 glycoside hydrolase family 97 protein [Pedobacter hiemivivus]